MQIATIEEIAVRKVLEKQSMQQCAMSQHTDTSHFGGVLYWRALMKWKPPHGLHPTCALLSALAQANPALVRKEAA